MLLADLEGSGDLIGLERDMSGLGKKRGIGDAYG